MSMLHRCEWSLIKMQVHFTVHTLIHLRFSAILNIDFRRCRVVDKNEIISSRLNCFLSIAIFWKDQRRPNTYFVWSKLHCRYVQVHRPTCSNYWHQWRLMRFTAGFGTQIFSNLPSALFPWFLSIFSKLKLNLFNDDGIIYYENKK